VSAFLGGSTTRIKSERQPDRAEEIENSSQANPRGPDAVVWRRRSDRSGSKLICFMVAMSFDKAAMTIGCRLASRPTCSRSHFVAVQRAFPHVERQKDRGRGGQASYKIGRRTEYVASASDIERKL